MKYDLHMAVTSDLVVVNFDGNPNSIGTAGELFRASDRGIPIIGYCTDKFKSEIHPWYRELCMSMFYGTDQYKYDQMDDMIFYIKSHFIDL